MATTATRELLAALPALSTDGRPAASRVAVAVAAPIRAGTWPVGMRLPTSAAIAGHLGTSVDAVRAGTGLLISHGLVRRVPGGDVIVTDEQADRDRWR